jgi:outer membrane protein OmpA-like peptidoglycan-associated protein
MKKTAYAFLFVSIFIYTHGNAQLRTALTAGVQSSSVPGNSNTQWDTLTHQFKSRIGFNIGLLAEAPFFNSSSLYFRTGMTYSNKGRNFSSSYDTTSGIKSIKGKQFINYMEVPLNIVYKKDLGKKSRLVMGAGPYVAFLFSGREATQTQFSNGSVQTVENTSLKLPRSQATYKNIDAGLNAFAGLEFGRIFMNGIFSKGLTSFYKPFNSEGTFKHQVVGASLGVYLNRETRSSKKERDRDHDGVPDKDDACPRDKGSVATGGCPDKDSDGVSDKDDSCPTIAGTNSRKGCPAPDSDKDGVNDDEDKCPNVKGTKDSEGCPESAETLKGAFENYAKRIQFRYKSAELTDDSKDVLDIVVKILKRNPELNVLIEGYTSKDGKNHQKISEARALSVKEYLEQNGVKSKRLKAIGFGASNPVNAGKTEAERALNRRVELKITR